MQYNTPSDIVGELKELTKRVERLEQSVQIGDTSIDNGALTVLQDGALRVKVGELDDGTYGLAVYNDAGQALPLSQLAFGLAANEDPASTTPALNTWVADTSVAVPNVAVKNGRMIVVVSVRINAGSGGGGTPADGWYGFGLAGPTNISPSFADALYCRYNGTGMDANLQASWWAVVTGLTNGTYTVTPQMYAGSIGTPTNSTTFSNRSCTILPY